jgi:hypothetical protein
MQRSETEIIKPKVCGNLAYQIIGVVLGEDRVYINRLGSIIVVVLGQNGGEIFLRGRHD